MLRALNQQKKLLTKWGKMLLILQNTYYLLLESKPYPPKKKNLNGPKFSFFYCQLGLVLRSGLQLFQVPDILLSHPSTSTESQITGYLFKDLASSISRSCELWARIVSKCISVWDIMLIVCISTEHNSSNLRVIRTNFQRVDYYNFLHLTMHT